MKILFSNLRRAASSSSWGLLVAAMTSILSPDTAIIYVHVGMCAHICTYAHTYVCIYILCTCAYVCIYMHVYIHVCVYLYTRVHTSILFICTCAYMYRCMGIINESLWGIEWILADGPTPLYTLNGKQDCPISLIQWMELQELIKWWRPKQVN